MWLCSCNTHLLLKWEPQTRDQGLQKHAATASSETGFKPSFGTGFKHPHPWFESEFTWTSRHTPRWLHSGHSHRAGLCCAFKKQDSLYRPSQHEKPSVANCVFENKAHNNLNRKGKHKWKSRFWQSWEHTNKLRYQDSKLNAIVSRNLFCQPKFSVQFQNFDHLIWKYPCRKGHSTCCQDHEMQFSFLFFGSYWTRVPPPNITTRYCLHSEAHNL